MASSSDVRVTQSTLQTPAIRTTLSKWRAAGRPLKARVVIELYAPTGHAKASRMQYRRMSSWLVDCKTPQAFDSKIDQVTSALLA